MGKYPWARRAVIAAGVLMTVGGALVATPALAGGPGGGPPDDKVCPGLDSGKIDVAGNKKQITVTAPEGKLIVEYCVKAGSVQQGYGPETRKVHPPKKTVTFSHSSGKDISHYSVKYKDKQPPTTSTTTTTTTTTTTEPTQEPKVWICYKGETKKVPAAELRSWLKKGATEGKCPPPEPCEWDPNLPADDPYCKEPPEPCEWDPNLPADDPYCKEPPEPCEWDPSLPADDPYCEPDPTVPPTDPTVPPTDPTVPPTEPTVPPTEPTVPPTEPTVPAVPDELSVTAIAPVCLRDAPYIDVFLGQQPQFNGRAAQVRFIDVNGDLAGTHTATYQAGARLRFLYPGAQVDANGDPVDWPGWAFVDGQWVPDSSDAHLRDGLTVEVEVNPTAIGRVTYPLATRLCMPNPRIVGGVSSATPEDAEPVLLPATR